MSAEGPLESAMERYIAGDLQAFDVLYERVAPHVFRYLLSMTGDRARAEDLCQTAFLKLHRARSGWIPGSPVLPWIMVIARNALYDDYRQKKRNRVRVTTTGDVPELAIFGVFDGALDEEADEPSVEMVGILAGAVAALPPRQREALALTKQGGLSHRDAALALGTTETAVKLRVHRAYLALREVVRKHRGRDI